MSIRSRTRIRSGPELHLYFTFLILCNSEHQAQFKTCLNLWAPRARGTSRRHCFTSCASILPTLRTETRLLIAHALSRKSANSKPDARICDAPASLQRKTWRERFLQQHILLPSEQSAAAQLRASRTEERAQWRAHDMIRRATAQQWGGLQLE